jgi:hypothetical protein
MKRAKKKKIRQPEKKDTKTAAAKKSTKVEEIEKAEKKPVPGDFAQVRKNIATLVRGSAEDIAAGIIAGAKAGQLAPAKYLFEAVGLYPATEETVEKTEEPLAYTLLKRMGLADESGIGDEAAPLGMKTTRPADRAEEDLKCDGVRNASG